MTRYAIIWSPLYSKGKSRNETIQAFMEAWRVKAPWLIKRRTIKTATTTDTGILRRCSEWMKKYWGCHLKHSIKSLDVVIISDPNWEEDEPKYKTSLEAIRNGYEFEAAGRKPQHCILEYETEEILA